MPQQAVPACYRLPINVLVTAGSDRNTGPRHQTTRLAAISSFRLLISVCWFIGGDLILQVVDQRPLVHGR